MNPLSPALTVIFPRPGEARLVHARVPEPDAESVVVATTCSGISLGTEMKLYRGLSLDKAGEVWFPLVPGYESVGRVLAVGPQVRPQDNGYLPCVGDRVMANEVRVFPDYCAAWGGQTALAVKNPRTAGGAGDGLALIPPTVSDEAAVWAYLAAVALKGIDRVRPQDGETILVVGCGQVGLAAIQLAKIAARCRVLAIDRVSCRAQRAAPFADAVVDAAQTAALAAVRELTGGRGVDAVLECSGDPEVVNTLKGYLKSGGWGHDDPPGRIHLQGDYPRPIVLTPYQDWFTTNATITMSCACGPGHKTRVLKLLAEGRLQAAWGPVYPVEQAPRAYAETDRDYFAMVKPLLRWH